MVFQRPATRTALALLVLAAFALQPLALAEDFSWQPKPLVDTSKPVVHMPDAVPAQPQAPSQPEIEARLKPAEPFIADVESKLYIKPKTGSTLVSRLNTLQNVLFGEQKYKDAGQLLSKLADLYPQEAAKAQATLMAEMKTAIPPGQPAPGKVMMMKARDPKALPPNNGVIDNYPPAGGNGKQAPPSQYYPQPQQSAVQQYQQPQQPQAKKKHFWESKDDDWSDFDKDPFFKDNSSNFGDSGSSSYSSEASGGSKVGAIAQGLGSLAMLAGGLAGSYYLNKKLGGTSNRYPDNGYYGNPYGPGYAPYGYGNPGGYNGYVYSPYGTQYANPYGNNGYYPQNGGYPSLGYYGYNPYAQNRIYNPTGGGITVRPYTGLSGMMPPLGNPLGN